MYLSSSILSTWSSSFPRSVSILHFINNWSWFSLWCHLTFIYSVSRQSSDCYKWFHGQLGSRLPFLLSTTGSQNSISTIFQIFDLRWLRRYPYIGHLSHASLFSSEKNGRVETIIYVEDTQPMLTVHQLYSIQSMQCLSVMIWETRDVNVSALLNWDFLLREQTWLKKILNFKNTFSYLICFHSISSWTILGTLLWCELMLKSLA